MKKLISILVLVSYLIVLLRHFLPYLEYALNKEYIATHLCVNRDKPEMHCNGKCHLKKELQKATGEEEPRSHHIPTLRIEIEKYFVAIRQVTSLNLSRVPHKSGLSFLYSFIIKEHIPEVPTPPPKPTL